MSLFRHNQANMSALAEAPVLAGTESAEAADGSVNVGDINGSNDSADSVSAGSDGGVNNDGSAEPGREEAASAAAEAAPTGEAEFPRTAQLTAADEERWQQAVRAVAADWPQLKDDLPRVVACLRQISAGYGDADLWQRAPAGILREAAVQLYGMPAHPEPEALTRAVRSAHEAGLQAGQLRHQARSGLAPAPGARHTPPPLTAEQRIVHDMRAARKGRLF